MANFNFISDEDFRVSLENDYRELEKAKQSESWKSLHVLAGSIVEAVLADYLISIDYHQKKSGTNVLSMDLGQLIKASEDQGILTSKSAGLSNVIREYRNLIHPGRQIRLKEKVDRNSSQVATALVEMIVEEVSNSHHRVYGPTAEQIVAKIERDPSAVSIVSKLLNSMKPKEIERLLLNVLPNRYFSIILESVTWIDGSSPDLDSLPNLEACFRHAFQKSTEATKKIVTRHFVNIVKEEDQNKVFRYETAFFRCTDLKYMQDKEEIELIKTHILCRLKNELNEALLNALSGFGAFLDKTEVMDFVDPLILALLPGKKSRLELQARSTLIKEGQNISGKKTQEAFMQRLNEWITHLEEKVDASKAEKVKEIKGELEMPF
jgi:hypothetical protein